MSDFRPSDEPFVSSVRLGAFTLSAISQGTLYWAPEMTAPEEDWRRAMPEADADGRIPCALNSFVVRTADAVVLIDPGPDEADTPWSAGFHREFPGTVRTAGLAAGLSLLGLDPAEVTHVVISHAHFDHFAAVTQERDGEQAPRFPNSVVALHRREWEGNSDRDQPGSDLADRLGVIDRARRLNLMEGTTEIVPGVSLIEAPGESPGHLAVRVESDAQAAWLVGDLAHHACEIGHLDWMPAGRDAAPMRDSRDRIYTDAADTGAIVAFTHERFPPWGHIVRADGGYRWRRLDPTTYSVL